MESIFNIGISVPKSRAHVYQGAGTMLAAKISRRQKEILRHKDEVLNVAADLFYGQGFAKTTVQEIAQAAQFGIGTIYRLFPGGKDALYRALQERVVAFFEETVETELAAARTESEIVRRYIRAGATVYARYPREMTMYVRDSVGLSTHLGRGLDSDLASRYMACAEPAAKALDRGARMGLFREVDPELAIICLRAVMNACLITWLDDPRQEALDEHIDFMEQLFFHGVTRRE